MFTFLGLVVLVTASVAGGWYLKSKYGAKVAADVAKVSDTAKTL